MADFDRACLEFKADISFFRADHHPYFDTTGFVYDINLVRVDLISNPNECFNLRVTNIYSFPSPILSTITLYKMRFPPFTYHACSYFNTTLRHTSLLPTSSTRAPRHTQRPSSQPYKSWHPKPATSGTHLPRGRNFSRRKQ